mgnify:CR=1 FL=1
MTPNFPPARVHTAHDELRLRAHAKRVQEPQHLSIVRVTRAARRLEMCFVAFDEQPLGDHFMGGVDEGGSEELVLELFDVLERCPPEAREAATDAALEADDGAFAMETAASAMGQADRGVAL